MSDEELAEAIIAFKREVKDDSAGVVRGMDWLDGALKDPPVCTVLTDIRKTDEGKLQVVTSDASVGGAYEMSAKKPVTVVGAGDVDKTGDEARYTADLLFSGEVMVNGGKADRAVLAWPGGRAIDGTDADDLPTYDKYEPKKYDNEKTKYKFSTAGVSVSPVTCLSATVTGASLGITGAEFSVCLLEDVFRVLSQALFGFKSDWEGVEVKVGADVSKLKAIALFALPFSSMMKAFNSETGVVTADL